MSSLEYHERLWEAIPEGTAPSLWEQRRAFLLDRVRAGDRVLDVGCGEGAFSEALLDAGAAPVGIDVAEEPLRRARRRRPELDLRLVDQGAPWPVEDGGFDLVWAGEVIEHVLDTAGWLSNVRRALRSGGRLLITTPAHDRFLRLAFAVRGRSFDSCFDPRSDHLRFYTRRTIRELLVEFRFEEVKIASAGGFPGARETMLVSASRARF